MGGKAGRHGKRSRPKDPATIQINKPSVRGTVTEFLEVEEWADELHGSGYSEYYSNRTRPVLESHQKRLPRGTRGFSQAANNAGQKGWMSKAFGGQSKPDFIAIDRVNKRILVGDVTAKASSPASIRTGQKRHLPRGTGFRETRIHLDQTIDFAERLSGHLPDDMQDFEVVAQDRYREQIPNSSKQVTVYKNGRFVRPSAHWRNKGRKAPPKTKPGGSKPGKGPSNDMKKARGTANTATENKVEGSTAKPKSQTVSTPKKAATIKPSTKQFRKTNVPKLTPSAGKFTFRLVKGVFKGFLADLALGLVVSYFEGQIAKETQTSIRRAWKTKVFPYLENHLKFTTEQERTNPESFRNHQLYILIRWDVITQEQDENVISDTALWIVKFVSGDPGFVELFHSLEPQIGNKIYNQYLASPPKEAEPVRRRVKGADDLIRYRHSQWILVWDPDVHNVAEKSREFQKGSEEVLRKLVKKIAVVDSKGIVSERIEKISKAISEMDFRTARRHTRQLKFMIHGQRWRTFDGLLEELATALSLPTVLSVYRNILSEDQLGLLSGYLGRPFDEVTFQGR